MEVDFPRAYFFSQFKSDYHGFVLCGVVCDMEHVMELDLEIRRIHYGTDFVQSISLENDIVRRTYGTSTTKKFTIASTTCGEVPNVTFSCTTSLGHRVSPVKSIRGKLIFGVHHS